MSEEKKTEPLLELELDDTDRRFLYTSMALLSQRANDETARAAFGLIAVKLRDSKKIFSKGETDLMHRIVSATLDSGAKVKARTEDLEARVRASAVEAAYETIKGKLENGKPII